MLSVERQRKLRSGPLGGKRVTSREQRERELGWEERAKNMRSLIAQAPRWVLI
jgi:hypothetical protein